MSSIKYDITVIPCVDIEKIWSNIDYCVVSTVKDAKMWKF